MRNESRLPTEFYRSGVAVLPLHGKIPIAEVVPHGFKDATTDEAQIEAWASQFPGCNWGWVVPEGVIVFDVDPRNFEGADVGRVSLDVLEERLGAALPDSLIILSGRRDTGGHFVFSFTLPEKRRYAARLLGSGIDLRTAGKGYLVAPGSIHPDTGDAYLRNGSPINPLPQSFAAAFTEQLPEQVKRDVKQTGNGQGLLKTLIQASEGERNEKLFWAARKAAAEGQPETFFNELTEVALQRGLSLHEIETTLRSARRVAA